MLHFTDSGVHARCQDYTEASYDPTASIHIECDLLWTQNMKNLMFLRFVLVNFREISEISIYFYKIQSRFRAVFGACRSCDAGLRESFECIRSLSISTHWSGEIYMLQGTFWEPSQAEWKVVTTKNRQECGNVISIFRFKDALENQLFWGARTPFVAVNVEY